MDYDYSSGYYATLFANSQHWVNNAIAAEWLNADSLQLFASLETKAPETIFDSAQARPLIVAFIGGTGVGKSSLLNRLANKEIALSGLERPTSREITLFHHKAVTLQHLPEQRSGIPLQQTRIAKHDDDQNKNIMWVDMPDFDSTEQDNKQQVLAWLPYIDVLIYVVSPERYRDAKAWRLLLAEGNKHAWLFVFNQWDKGLTEQYEDFAKQLQLAGFKQPIIFKTSCEKTFQPDEFSQLTVTLSHLATDHTIKYLAHRSDHTKQRQLKQTLLLFHDLLGSTDIFQQLPTVWDQLWRHTQQQLQLGLAWSIQRWAQFYVTHQVNWVASSFLSRSDPNQSQRHQQSDLPPIWDDWASTRFDDALDELMGEVDQLGGPLKPLKQQLVRIRKNAGKIIQHQCETTARQSLLHPGNKYQRLFLATMRMFELILPLLAMAWAGYQIVAGYYVSNQSGTAYLGLDFAVHSSLLILISWLTPFFLQKKMQPSVEKAALNGLERGLVIGMNTINQEILLTIDQVNHQHQEQLRQLNGLIDNCNINQAELPTDNNTPLNQMLL